MSRAKRRKAKVEYVPAYVDPASFFRARTRGAFSVEAAAKLLRVHPRTVRNWESGRTRVPYAALRLLRLEPVLKLGSVWRGWSVRGDCLYSPAGQRFSLADLEWLSLTFRRAEAFWTTFARVRMLEEGRFDHQEPLWMVKSRSAAANEIPEATSNAESAS